MIGPRLTCAGSDFRLDQEAAIPCLRELAANTADCPCPYAGCTTSTDPQGKLVMPLRGEVFDVAVDIRGGSATFGSGV